VIPPPQLSLEISADQGPIASSTAQVKNFSTGDAYGDRSRDSDNTAGRTALGDCIVDGLRRHRFRNAIRDSSASTTGNIYHHHFPEWISIGPAEPNCRDTVRIGLETNWGGSIVEVSLKK